MKNQSLLSKLRWYVARLRVMSAREMGHRAWSLGVGFAFYCRYIARAGSEQRPARVRYAFAGAERAPIFSQDIAFATLSEQEAAEIERHLANAGKQDWHVALDTGRHWPRKFYGFVSFRAANPTGDARTTWELSRLQNLVDMACLYRQSGCPETRTRIAAAIVATYQSWNSANPFLCGINYISVMECALRIIALSASFDIIRNDVPDAVWSRLGTTITEHATLIHHRLSLHSSAGNHTVAEAAGLVFAGALFSDHGHASRWLARGIDTLERELIRQIHPDGGSLEQATDYLQLVTELGLLAQIVLRSAGRTLQPGVLQRLASAQDFLAALHYSPAELFHFGDSDSSQALSRYARLLPPPAPAQPPSWKLTRFPESGLTCLEWTARTHAFKLLFHHHNLGMPPLFGHGHAGILAIELAVDGTERLIDCGTYAYNSGDKWRRYLRGTRAHNTIVVDDNDQALQLSNFQWSHDVAARLVEPGRNFENGVFGILAAHEGYRENGILHYRAILVDRSGELVVWDYIAGESQHTVQANWHTGDNCIATRRGYMLQPATGAAALEMEFFDTNTETSIHYKSEAPIAGWRSRSYGVLEGASTLSRNYTGALPLAFLTRLRMSDSSGENDGWWQRPIEEFMKRI